MAANFESPFMDDRQLHDDVLNKFSELRPVQQFIFLLEAIINANYMINTVLKGNAMEKGWFEKIKCEHLI